MSPLRSIFGRPGINVSFPEQYSVVGISRIAYISCKMSDRNEVAHREAETHVVRVEDSRQADF